MYLGCLYRSSGVRTGSVLGPLPVKTITSHRVTVLHLTMKRCGTPWSDLVLNNLVLVCIGQAPERYRCLIL